MSNMAEYARIFDTGTDDGLVEKRLKAVAEIKAWFESLTPDLAISTASRISSSFGTSACLPDEIAVIGEEKIQRHAVSFVRSANPDDLQIKVVLAVAAIDVFQSVTAKSGGTSVDALAAAFWSALAFQRPLELGKVERLRQDLLAASRTHVLKIADATRARQTVPSIGLVSISQDSTQPSRVNKAFSQAVEPMISAMRENAVLDREELDFMWWLLSGRSELLDEPLDSLPGAVRAVAAGLDGALKLRRLPADAHRNIVLRNIENGEPLSLMELIELLGERRTKLATNFDSIRLMNPRYFRLWRRLKPGVLMLAHRRKRGPLGNGGPARYWRGQFSICVKGRPTDYDRASVYSPGMHILTDWGMHAELCHA